MPHHDGAAAGAVGGPFADVSEKLVDAWRAGASKEYPASLLRMKRPVRLTLQAALCHVRQTEITDSLVELFIQLVLMINTRAERKVERELGAELKQVRGKEAMLLRVAEAALAEPAGVVRWAIYPVVGEKALTWPARTRSRRRCSCSPCTFLSPPWSTSAPCCFSRSSPAPSESNA